ncbi:MAG: DNA translocase FtsK [Immundisolibacter sp.]|uniref:DNA translocase FtsK n=1 Tax=Immundisolibacter sp. TaxID=1934948 RepID=UPI003EDF60FB
MPRPRRQQLPPEPTRWRLPAGLRETVVLLLLASATFLLLALLSFDPLDSSWASTGGHTAAQNAGGRIGANWSSMLYYFFGYPALFLPCLMLWFAWRVYLSGDHGVPVRLRGVLVRTLGLLLAITSGSALAQLYLPNSGGLPNGPGGGLGLELGRLAAGSLNTVGATLFLTAACLSGITWITGLSWLKLTELLGIAVVRGAGVVGRTLRAYADAVAGKRAREDRRDTVDRYKAKEVTRKPPRIEPVLRPVEIVDRVEAERQVELFKPAANTTLALPPLSLLDDTETKITGLSAEALQALSRRLELKLEEFGIAAQVVEVHPGPVVTRFEIDLAAGVKVSQVTGLSKDLARSLSVVSVRVVEVIPGKSTVGIEIPNEQRELIRFSQTLRSRAYDDSTSPLTLALGKDIQGVATVADLGKMPHLLVSGTTGSGKSVAVNAMVLSLLFKATPDEVRMIMIDPKMLELSVYEGIPHLLCPVITDMNDAQNALRWSVAEMERRYKRMAALGVRNIAGYNRKVREAEAAGTPIPDPFPIDIGEDAEPAFCETLPYLVVFVDEFADMMMVVGKKVEQLIARLAQKARAAGVHLILATQRPSVDVITGLIKANIPARIAFQVSSKIDSRTILDQMGAEALLGHGDMLYLPPGTSIPTRVHGAFVSDEEVHRVVAHIKASGQPNYRDEILRGDFGEDSGDGNGSPFAAGEREEGGDELYDKAVFLVTSSRRASVSGVQRHLRIGYNRAARLVEEMERTGIVGPLKSNGSRDVLAEAPPGA